MSRKRKIGFYHAGYCFEAIGLQGGSKKWHTFVRLIVS